MNKLKIIWTHSFRQDFKGSGSFMYEQLSTFQSLGIDIEQIVLTKIFNPINFIYQYIKYRSLNPDILHAQYGSGNGYLTSLFKAKKKILTIRGSDWYFNSNQNFLLKIRSYISILLTKISLNKFDYIIVMSNRIKNEIALKYPKHLNKIYVVTDGIDLNKFYPLNKAEAKQKINVSETSFLIGLGSIDPNNSIKNIPLAISAIQLSEDKIQNVEFLVISNIPHENIYLYLSACDMILLTSRYEGWPNIIKEALACNTPFVSTDVSDLRIIASKTNFCFIADSNPVSVSNRIIQLHNMVKKSEPDNLLELAAEFSLPINIDKILKIYNL